LSKSPFTVQWIAVWLSAFLLLLALACWRAEEPTKSAGVVVESLSAKGAAARGGLRPGDVLLSWHRAAATGPLRSCDDVATVEIEQAPRGPVEVRRLRGGRVSALELPAGDWEAEVLPRKAGDGGCRAQARARRLVRERKWREAAAAWAEARPDRGGDVRAARILRERGLCFTALDDFPQAEAALNESLRRLRRAAPGSLDEAASWHALGRLEQRRGAYPRSEEHLRRALALRSRLAPESLERASTLNNLGIDAWLQGDLRRAKPLYVAALTLVRPRAPGSLDEARVLNNLGLLTRDAGDAVAAASYLGQAGRIWQRLDPDGQDVARNYVNLGALAADRGDLALSDRYYRQALRRYEGFGREGLESARILTNLGINAHDRFDLPAADLLLRQALAIRQRLLPGSLDEAASLSSLATTSQDLGRLVQAEDFARQALAIRTRHKPESLDVSVSLAILAGIASRRGDVRAAARLGERALVIQHRLAPGTIKEAKLLNLLGYLDLKGRRWSAAEARARQSLAICRRLTPQSYVEADNLNLLGRALWQSGRETEAASVFAAALDSLEAQTGRLGGTEESRSSFQAQFSPVYENRIALDLQRGDAAAALRTLERWRARMLLAQIAQRDLAFSADVPAPLLGRQRELDREYDQAQADLAKMDPRHGAELRPLLLRLSRLRNERSELVDRIVRASPHYASLRYPRPLDLAAARRALDPGTVWLSYFLAEDAAHLFVVTPEGSGEGLRVLPLSIGRRELEAEAAVFRGLILRGKGQTAVERSLLVQGRKLYDLLIAPAAPWIEGAERILISPDGPLHILPFAALILPETRPETRPGEPARFLVDWKPVHTVLSATLYAELKRGRRGGPSGAGPLVAFADPRLPAGAGPAAGEDDPPLRRYRAGLPPLPGAREEVQALTRLYGREALIYTGAAATEARVGQPGVRPRILHFASHALLDRRSPLDSALALAPSAPGGDGLLQAWEILERLRFDADLVTLSACGTGLGREGAGEGLIGLTRAFQYAGARSILASLWGVSDRSTAALMARFYAGLRAGLPKDEALAQAQRQLLRTGEHAHPYSWAGFELNGDWR
jgi:CHAT domain-containing protein/tetratricopeptide (TPR) repeat protein